MSDADIELVIDYLGGTLADERETEVELRLAAEPELAELLVEMACDEVVIQGWTAGKAFDQPIELDIQGSHVGLKVPPPGQRKTKRQTRVAAAVLAVALLSICVFGIWRIFRPEPAAVAGYLRELSGDVQVAASGAEPTAARPGMKLGFGTTLQTGVDSSAEIELADGTVLEAAGGAVLRIPAITDPSQDADIECSGGSIVATVAQQAEGNPFFVETPHTLIRVLGTRFVTQVTNARTRVDVHEGDVRLTHGVDGKSVDLKADQFAVVFPFSDSVTVPLPVDAPEPVVLFPVADAHHNEWAAGQNFGKQERLETGQGGAAFLKFDVPAGIRIERAELTLHLLTPGEHVILRRAESNWEESDLTSNQRPRVIEDIASVQRAFPGAQGRNVTIDITPLVREAGTLTLAIYRMEGRAMMAFASRESPGKEPRLRINSP